MQAVGAVIDALSCYSKAGQATHPIGPLEGDLQPSPGSTPGGGKPGRPGAEDDEILRAVHGCVSTLSPRRRSSAS